jgi:glycosyltransferase involved in cell wall biosynthesis
VYHAIRPSCFARKYLMAAKEKPKRNRAASRKNYISGKTDPDSLKVSVLVTTYNRPAGLDRVLKDISRQTFKEYEVIIVDDGSRDLDKNAEVVEKFKKIIKKLNLIRNAENMGISFSRNIGIRAARYPLIAFADDDDEWMPEKLYRQVDVFKNSRGKTGLVYTWHLSKNSVTGNSALFKPMIKTAEAALKETLRQCFFQTSSVMVKRDLLMEAGLFDEKLPNANDRDMWLRLFKRGCSCEVVKSPLVIYHQHLNSITYTKSSGLILCVWKHIDLYLKYYPLGIAAVFPLTFKRWVKNLILHFFRYPKVN